MKNLMTIFNLLLLPFIFAGRLISFNYSYIKKLKQPSNLIKKIITLIFLATFFTSSVHAETLTRLVATGNDDAEQDGSNNNDYDDNSDLDMNDKDWVAVRFQNITIPQGANITSATIQFRQKGSDTDTGQMEVRIHGEDVDNASDYSSGRLDQRTLTSENVDWVVNNDWSAGEQSADTTTNDISVIVQEIVDRAGWSAGNAMSFLFDDRDGSNRRPGTYERGSDYRAILVIDYGIPEPISEYRMDSCEWDGSNNEVTDSAGSVNGTSFNDANTTAINSFLCNSAYFDGDVDYVSMGDSFNNIFGDNNDEFTITAWIRPEALTTDTSNHGTANTFIAKASDNNNDNLEIGITSSGQLHLYLDTEDADTQANFGSGITTGSWHFIAVTYNGSDVTVNINGNTTTNSSWGGNLDQANGSPFTIGTTLHEDTHFTGLVDEVKIYDSALSENVINDIYTNDTAGNDYTGTPRTCQPCIPPAATAVDDNFNTLFNTPLSENVLTNDLGDGKQVILASVTTPTSGTVTMQTNGDFVYVPVAGFDGPASFEYTMRDLSGNESTATVTISIATQVVANAVNDSFTTQINTAVSGNVLTNDTGDGITVTSHINPVNGSVSINPDGSFTYTPNLGYVGFDTFEYTITDNSANTDDATVTITITQETDYQEGIQDFVLINPPATRNMIGNYAILGNTVECITTSSGDSGASIDPDHFTNAECTNSNQYNDNNYIAKYIDIDGSSGIGAPTWNSTSSNFTLPDTYYQENGRGIAWAGLFWQGAINNDLSNDQRRAYLSGATYDYKYITSDENIDLEATDGNKVLIRIDDDTSYTPLKAATFYYDTAFGNRGGYYAAYTDITYLLQNRNLAEGKHTITVANITANEGRQQGTGNYAGWSIVVIYKEAGDDAKARNISIYNGYTQVSNGSNTPPIEISGFKLPDSGEVNAQFAAFAGEGEYIYGDGAEYDRMVMGRTLAQVTGASPDTMPGATDPNNIFDAILANIDRDPGNYNEMTGNNNGIDIENYDVSDIMTDYRDVDENINTVYIGLSSSQDYITPSMLSFSAELYKPNVCYDYVVRRDEYTIPSNDKLIDTFMNVNDNLSITVAVRSLESDFDLSGSKLAITLNDTNGSALFDSGEYSPTTSNILLPTGVTSTSTPFRPEIAVGKDRDELTGGTIGSFERYYTKYNYIVNEVVGGRFQTEFNIELNTTIDFGSGPVSQLLPLVRCEQSPVYNPVWGQFNVERNFATVPPVSEPTARYSLYTQIAGKDFDYSVAHYDTSDPVTPLSISNATVDVELIDASAFDDNSSFLKCSNTDPSIIIGGLHTGSTFVNFAGTDRVNITNSFDLVDTPALKSAVFRMWTLLDENGTLILHNNNKEDGDQFKIIYDENYKDTIDLANPKLCGVACGDSNGIAGREDCYRCLRTYFATPNCSRDNFAIRPESYRISLIDNNEDISTPLPVTVTTNDATMSEKSFAAEYRYKMTGNSMRFGGTLVAQGYYNENFLTATTDMITSPNEYEDVIALEFDDLTACQDTNDSVIQLSFSNGSIDDYNLSHDNAGDYNLWIEDNQWTKVDQADHNPYKTIFDDNCRALTITSTVDPSCNDCILGANDSTTAPKVGCQTDSNIVDNTNYNVLELEFEPYQFAFQPTGAAMFHTRPNDNGTHLYMGDLNKSLVMAAKLEGNITAEGKEGTILSNFTDGCAAEDVILWLDRTMIPQESTIRSEAGTPVAFQQVLQDIYDINYFSTDTNSTLQKDNFSDATDNNGSAEVDLYFNFEKPYAELVNPIDVNFSILNAVSPNAASNAHLVADYEPDGNTTINEKRYFYFAKVSPPDGVDGSETYETLVSTILKVNTFCRDDLNTTCALLPGLPIVPENVFPGGGWYRMESHLSSLGDGQVNNLSTTVPGVSISPSSNITFDSNGSTSNIDITYPLTGRPVHPVIVIDPDEWLKYNPDVLKDGLPEFTIHFLNRGLKWKGEGETGHVVDTEPSTGSNQRISW